MALHQSIRMITLLYLATLLLACTTTADDKPFRPEMGKFPPLEKAHSYRGELTFVDHTNRRGSIRIQGNGKFRFTGPSPFDVAIANINFNLTIDRNRNWFVFPNHGVMDIYILSFPAFDSDPWSKVLDDCGVLELRCLRR